MQIMCLFKNLKHMHYVYYLPLQLPTSPSAADEPRPPVEVIPAMAPDVPQVRSMLCGFSLQTFGLKLAKPKFL
jgi:hypothetical protein